MKQPIQRCSHCGAKVVKYKHVLNKNLISVLAYMADNDGRLVMKGARLTHNQLCNANKLQYFGLIVSDEKHGGVWLLTQLGWEFLAGDRSVPKAAWTYRGEVVQPDKKEAMVTIRDVHPSAYRRRDDYVKDAQFAADGQGRFF